MLLAGCSTTDETPVAGKQLPGMIVDDVVTIGKLQQVDYRDAKSGDRYRLQASLDDVAGKSGWIEARATKATAESVRIEWTPTMVRLATNHPDGSGQFYAMGRDRGLDQIDFEKLKRLHDDDAVVPDQPFLVQSATHADLLLDTTKLAMPLAAATELLTQAPPATHPIAAETFNCDNSIDISDNCGVEAKLARTTKQVFKVDAGVWLDKNTMDLKCGDTDGLVRIQACPLAAYNCDTYKGAKKEQPLSTSEPSDDADYKTNQACKILKAEGEGRDVGKKFTVTGLAEIRPGKAVRPKDPGDEAKLPSDCKLVWDLPEEPDYVYHQQWGDEHTTDKSHNKKFEVAISAAAETGSLAIGGKSEVNATVHTCQDSDVGRDDYAFYIRGSKSNALYTCSN